MGSLESVSEKWSAPDLGVKNERRDICFWREDGPFLVLEWVGFFTPPLGFAGVFPDMMLCVRAKGREGEERLPEKPDGGGGRRRSNFRGERKEREREEANALRVRG